MELKIYKKLWLLAVIFCINIIECHLQEISNGSELERQSFKTHNEDSHLPRHITPNSYKVLLTPFFDKGIFQGRIEINISCHEPTDTIALHVHRELEVALDGLTVHSVGVFQRITDQNVLEKLCQSRHNPRMEDCDFSHSIQIARHERNDDEDLFIITLQRKMAKGFFYHFSMNFLGHINMSRREGFYRRNYNVSGSEEERWFASIYLDKKNARKVFPCFDEPYFKARIQLHISMNTSLSAISTMPLKSTNAIKNVPDMKLDLFELSPPMTLGSFGLFIFDPTHIKPLATGMIGDVSVHGYGDSKLATEFQSKIDDVIARLTVFEKKFGFHFPLPALNLVALPLQQDDGDFWGLITFSENQLSYQSLSCPVFFLLPRQWIGHMVTPEPQSKPLNVGLQTYLAFASLMDEKNDEVSEVVHLWPMILASELYNMQPNKEWLNILHNAWVCRMLNYTLTEQTFKYGLYNFLHLRAFKTYNEADFYLALDNQAWLDSVLPENESVEVIFKSWTEKLTFPIVTVTRNYEKHSATLQQHQFIPTIYQNETDEIKQSLFRIPITYKEGNTYFITEDFATWMTQKQMTLSNFHDASLYLIINPEQIGVFPVNYDATNWGLLIRHLLISAASPNSTMLLPSITRCKLLYDAVFLALNEELGFGTALDVTQFMKYEKSPSLWLIMNDIMYILERKLYDTPVYDKFVIYGRFLYAKAYRYFKCEKVESFVESIPSTVEKIAAEVGYQPALVDAKTHFQAALRNNSWLDYRRSCAVLRWSDEDWEQTLEYTLGTIPTNESSDVNYFAPLVWCTRNPKNLISILRLVFVDSTYTFSDKDVENILYAIHDYHTLLKFILRHWNEVKTQCGDNQELWNLLFEEATKDIKTEEGLELMFQLYREHQNDLGSAKVIVEKSMTAQDNIATKYSYVKEINEWLDLHENFLA